MKLRIEINPDSAEEVVIHLHAQDEKSRILCDKISEVLEPETTLSVYLGEREYCIPRREVLFFETDNGKTAVHTADKMFYTEKKLYELEKIMPSSFLRVSKSCVVNLLLISSFDKGISGICAAEFVSSPKKIYISRMYSKLFRDKINELRFNK